MGINLINPTVYLFLSDLRRGLGESDQKHQEQWRRSSDFYRRFQHDLRDLDNQQLDQAIQKLRDKEDLSGFQKLPDMPSFKGDGCYQALLIDDTYCLITNYSVQNDPPKPLLDPEKHWGLDEFLERQKYPATLGETWLYRAQIDDSASFDTTAQEIYQAIVRKTPEIWSEPNQAWEKDLANGGQVIWQGGYLYELWHEQPDHAPDLRQEIPRSPHILIWLFPASIDSSDVFQRTKSLNEKLLYLIHARHKILAATHWSWEYSQNLKADYQKIITYLKDFKHGIVTDRQLQNILISLADFTYRLDLFQSQSHTIAANAQNYQDLLMQDAEAYKVPPCFKTFLERVPKYQQQIELDYAQLAPSREILQILSQSVQGTIQINQTKVDRTTNITIAAIATSIATSQLLSAVITTKKPTVITTEKPLPPSKGFLADTIQYAPLLLTDPILYVSLSLSFFFGATMFVMLRWLPHWWAKVWRSKKH
jgi:hypothetical protein